jgi:hypothetical protein
MIEPYYELNGKEGRPMNAASLAVLRIVGNPLMKEGATSDLDISSFLFVHFGDWKTVNKLASKVYVTQNMEPWVEAVLDWSAEMFQGLGALAGVEAGTLAATMLENGFKTRVSVTGTGEGGEPGKETPPTGLPA